MFQPAEPPSNAHGSTVRTCLLDRLPAPEPPDLRGHHLFRARRSPRHLSRVSGTHRRPGAHAANPAHATSPAHADRSGPNPSLRHSPLATEPMPQVPRERHSPGSPCHSPARMPLALRPTPQVPRCGTRATSPAHAASRNPRQKSSAHTTDPGARTPVRQAATATPGPPRDANPAGTRQSTPSSASRRLGGVGK